jgi:hypothetical protein
VVPFSSEIISNVFQDIFIRKIKETDLNNALIDLRLCAIRPFAMLAFGVINLTDALDFS